MIRTLKLSLALLFLVSMVSLGMAASATADKRAIGTVVSVDATALTVVVKIKKAESTFSADDKTVIKVGADVKTLADLKAGDKVIVMYKIVEKKKVATAITVATVKTTK